MEERHGETGQKGSESVGERGRERGSEIVSDLDMAYRAANFKQGQGLLLAHRDKDFSRKIHTGQQKTASTEKIQCAEGSCLKPGLAPFQDCLVEYFALSQGARRFTITRHVYCRLLSGWKLLAPRLGLASFIASADIRAEHRSEYKPALVGAQTHASFDAVARGGRELD